MVYWAEFKWHIGQNSSGILGRIQVTIQPRFRRDLARILMVYWAEFKWQDGSPWFAWQTSGCAVVQACLRGFMCIFGSECGMHPTVVLSTSACAGMYTIILSTMVQCQCVAVCCSVLQCVAACCTVLQRVAVCCSVLQCVAYYNSTVYMCL